LPKYVYTGPSITSQLIEILNSVGFNKGKVMIITGSNFTKKIGLDLVKPKIESEGIEVINLSIENFDDLIKNLEDRVSKIKQNNIKLLIGVGGGKVIDCTKILSLFSNKPYISYPTNSSHDGLSSPTFSFIAYLKLKSKYNFEYKLRPPLAIIADTSIIIQSPAEYIFTGIGDLLAKITATRDWRLAHLLKGEEYSEYAASMALMSAKIIEKNINVITKDKEKAVSIIIKALIGSGIAISVAGSSRPASGSEHLFSHALDLLADKEGFKPAMHGIQCGIGTIVMSKLHNLNWKKIKNTLKKAGLPTTSKELQIEPKYLIKALMMANKLRKDRYTILGDTDISYNSAEKLLKETEII
jgi:Glycerol dehydrogenase and related enzymes